MKQNKTNYRTIGSVETFCYDAMLVTKMNLCIAQIQGTNVCNIEKEKVLEHTENIQRTEDLIQARRICRPTENNRQC